MCDAIKQIFFKKYQVDQETLDYIYNILLVMDYEDSDEMNSLFEFITNINSEISFELFINTIRNIVDTNKKNNIEISFGTKPNIISKNLNNNKIFPEKTIEYIDSIPNKKQIVDKYSLVEQSDTTYKPFVKFENEKKIRYLNNRIVSTKGDKYIDI